MNNRRNFLIQGTLATSAMLALKPLQTIARVTSPFTGFGGSNNKLIFLHTTGLGPTSDHQVIRYIKEIKNNNKHAILLKAGQDIQDETGTLTYDASMNESNSLSAMTGDYKIINKGNQRTGIITATPGEKDIIQKVNTLSSWLKKEKKCAVVVCLSLLGYKNKNTPDDITLAEKSNHLDIIIGGHAENFKAQPYIVLNSNQEEVIIHAAAGNVNALGKIEIDFDWQGRKRNISFSDQIAKQTTSAA